MPGNPRPDNELPVARLVNPQKVAAAANSAQSTEFDSDVRVVRLVSDVAIYFDVGADAEAADDRYYPPASTIEYVGVKSGEKIAVKKVSGSDGSVWMAECIL